ncbi:MAG: hypothetical protein HZB39_20115 [Planctomycetes bacterium]|nr:hypothetical protein [Planctomycetota bacterium]
MRDRRWRHALLEPQDDDRAVRRGQGVDRSAQTPVEFVRRRGVERIDGVAQRHAVGLGVLARACALRLAVELEDSCEPWHERPRTIPARRLLHCGHEGRLQGILRLGRVIAELHRKAEQAGSGRLEHHRERGRVAGAAIALERGFGARGGDRHARILADGPPRYRNRPARERVRGAASLPSAPA